MKRHAFVTGATGFLGRNLIEELVREDWDITALCLPTDKTEWLNPLGATIAIGNITDRESLVAAMPDSPDAVFHAAANTSTWSRNDEQQSRDNVFGTELMLDVAIQKATKRFIYTSSISAFGYQPGVCIDESTPSNAMTCGINYGKSKYLAEKLVRKAVQRGLFTVILNPVNMLGPYDVNNWTRQLIRPVIEEKLRVVPPGKAMWCYVKDAVDAHIAAVDRAAVQAVDGRADVDLASARRVYRLAAARRVPRQRQQLRCCRDLLACVTCSRWRHSRRGTLPAYRCSLPTSRRRRVSIFYHGRPA